MIRHCAVVSLLAIATSPLAAQDAAWDPTIPRGNTRTIEFTTDEGTWMSVDQAPDGTWLVFDLLGQVYRLPAAGGEAVSLTQQSGIALNYHPRISPDGRLIAFISDRGGQDNLWVMNADGSGPRPVFLDLNSRAVEPAWMPDGKSILATRRMKTTSGFYRTDDEIWRFPLDGSPPSVVVKLQASASSVPARAGVWAGQDRLQWASPTPDGRTVYFHSSLFAGADRHLRRVDLATGAIDDVTPSSSPYLACCGRPAYPLRLGEIAPEVSPDGRWLAFARKIPGARTSARGASYVGRTALWLRDLTTGAERVLMDPISNDAMELHPSWEHRALPGYSWARDGRSLVLTQGGKLRRVWVDDGRVETIPFRATVRRVLSEMARSRVTIDDGGFDARTIRSATTTPDGRTIVFEAAAQLWRVSLPKGSPSRLLEAPPPGHALGPSLSPDGRTVAFVSWSDSAVWHLYTVPTTGGPPTRLSSLSTRYLGPSWTADGRFVLVNQWDPALSYLSIGDGWRVARYPKDGGPAEIVRRAGPLWEGDPSDGEWSYRRRGNTLIGLRTAGASAWEAAAPAGAPAEARRSPDGRWIALVHRQDVYLASAAGAERGDSLGIDLAGARRLTRQGGRDPHWRGADELRFTSGPAQLVHRPSTGRTDTTPIRLRLPRDGARGTLALTGARIVTMDSAGVIERGTIVIRDHRLACVGSCSTEGVDRVIDASGATVIPGLIDVHAHHLREDGAGPIAELRPSSARYLAWGVTTVHDPAADFDQSFAIGEMIDAGRIVGPRTFSTGAALTCSDFDDLAEIDSYREADDQIARAVTLGAISIKDYKQCTRVQRQMLAESGRRHGVTMTSEGADPLYLLGLVMNGSTGWEHAIQAHPIYRDMVEFLGRARIHYSPQLILSDYPVGNALEYWMSREDLWRNRKVLTWSPWQETATRRIMNGKPAEEFLFPILSRDAAAIKRAGGYLTTGAHGEQDGLGTHWELWAFALGLSPVEALETATTDPAHFLGLEQELGSLRAGKLADLVVLDANPLDRIENTDRIRYVMKAGRLYDATTLDEIWPRRRPYGPKPWNPPEMLRDDIRPDDWWDRPGR
ncbi:MAG: amidohydrolase family protein [Gemmatimonadales bacterium]